MKIAISGKSGCGNTTVTKLVAQNLNIDYINFTFRNLAEEKGMTLSQVLEAARHDDYWDRETDKLQIEMAQIAGDCVLGSRLAIWLLEEADVKVYLFADTATRVTRILQREGGSFESIKLFTERRDAEDHERYLRIYNIDNDNYQFVDIIIDAGKYNAEEIAMQITDYARKKICVQK
ncbi:MAG: cytidylate kinase family protein [Spirochaetaceae bacterium]|jgi:cytidylate kinase|nr:cytidylate kinase family protein [Spirochaetaceae bacterium]